MQNIYKFLWARSSLAIHYGIWDQTTKTLQNALVNTNRILATNESICMSDIILDAGCGLGGSAIWLADVYGARVVGVTTSKRQASFAYMESKKRRCNESVYFVVQDFTASGFQANTFSVVWAIESFCYVKNKIDLAKEIFRILKPGGRLLLADGFFSETEFESHFERLRMHLESSYNPLYLISISEFICILIDVGFEDISYQDYSVEIIPSANWIYRICSLALPVVELLFRLKAIDPLLRYAVRGGVAQRDFFQQEDCKYGIIKATKPN